MIAYYFQSQPKFTSRSKTLHFWEKEKIEIYVVNQKSKSNLNPQLEKEKNRLEKKLRKKEFMTIKDYDSTFKQTMTLDSFFPLIAEQNTPDNGYFFSQKNNNFSIPLFSNCCDISFAYIIHKFPPGFFHEWNGMSDVVGDDDYVFVERGH